MARPFLLFPGGTAGAALLLLRLSTAAAPLATLPRAINDRWICAAPLVAITGALILGIGTRIAAAVCVLGAAGLAIGADGASSAAATSILSAAALALLGPGAFSIDARRYGHRVITSDGARR